jgi:hypothetical protein
VLSQPAATGLAFSHGPRAGLNPQLVCPTRARPHPLHQPVVPGPGCRPSPRKTSHRQAENTCTRTVTNQKVAPATTTAALISLPSQEQIAEAVLEDQAVRLLTAMFMSLRHHKVNKRGQCRVCSRRIRMWRFWRRRPQCTLYLTLDFALNQGADVVWWQLFDILGRRATLEEVRVWVAGRRHTNGEV